MLGTLLYETRVLFSIQRIPGPILSDDFCSLNSWDIYQLFCKTPLLILVNNINKILTVIILQIVMDDGPLESHLLSALWMNNANNEFVYL